MGIRSTGRFGQREQRRVWTNHFKLKIVASSADTEMHLCRSAVSLSETPEIVFFCFQFTLLKRQTKNAKRSLRFEVACELTSATILSL